MFAWSATGFNLPQVHRPVMRAFGASERWTPPASKTPLSEPPLGFVAAAAAGRAHMARHAQAQGFEVREESGLSYLAASGTYLYRARTGFDMGDRHGGAGVWFSGVDGKELRFQPPMGRGPADGVNAWLNALHMANVLGLPYRILTCLIGLALVALSVTGVLIRMKKRAARLLRRPVTTAASRRQGPQPAGA